MKSELESVLGRIKQLGLNFTVVQAKKNKGKEEKVKIKLTCSTFMELNQALRLLNQVLSPTIIDLQKK